MNENLARTYRDSQRELWAENEMLRAENTDLRQQVERGIVSLDMAQSDAKSFARTIDTLRRRMKIVLVDRDTLLSQVDEGNKQCKSLQSDVQLLLRNLGQMMAERDKLRAEIGRLRQLLHAAYLEMDTHAIDCTLDAAYDEPCTCKVPELRRRIEAALRMSTAPTRPTDVSTNAQNVGMSADGQTEGSEA